MAKILIADVGFMLGQSKRKSHQELIVRMFTTYIGFLQEHGLTTRIILEGGALPDAKTRIMSSDLTEEGLTFVKKAEQKWFGAVDRGASPDDTSILAKELARLRSGRPGV